MAFMTYHICTKYSDTFPPFFTNFSNLNKLFDYLIMIVYANAGMTNSVNPDQTASSGVV